MTDTKTIFIDIDGSILCHASGGLSEYIDEINRLPNNKRILNGVREKFNEWSKKSYIIVVTTARPESLRQFTEQQLLREGLFYNHLIMGLSTGERHIINDDKPTGEGTAFAHRLKRNEGLGGVNI